MKDGFVHRLQAILDLIEAMPSDGIEDLDHNTQREIVVLADTLRDELKKKTGLEEA